MQLMLKQRKRTKTVEKRSNYIPPENRFCLTIEEAAAYSLIGENRLRSLLSNNPNANYILRVGNTVRIKRKQFEDYLNQINDI